MPTLLLVLSRRTCRALLTLILAAAMLGSSLGQARAQGISLIRDTEIERIIRAYAAPIFKAANLDPQAIRLHLVNDDSLNAFVAAGMNMFMHTGLLVRAEGPSQVIGVIAHETGHITGGHLTRKRDQMANASIAAALGMLLGVAAGLAAGSGDVGLAVMAGGQQIALSEFLRYSRGEESAADQAGVQFLDRAGISSEGLVDFMRILEDQIYLSGIRQDPYMSTHPLTSDRIAFLENHVAHSPATGTPINPEFVAMHNRMRAKLVGFLKPIGTTMARYGEDNSIPGRYARAIAHYRKADLDQAIPMVDGLISENPEDPYFLELKGQMLFENGRIEESLAPYRDAVVLLPDAPLLRLGLGQALIAMGGEQDLAEAETHLRLALAHGEDDSAFGWRLLATAYGRQGKEGLAAYAMAESRFLSGDYRDALRLSRRAAPMLEEGTPAWLRNQDVMALSASRVKDMLEEKRRR